MLLAWLNLGRSALLCSIFTNENLSFYSPITLECLDQNLLPLTNGTTRIYQPPGLGFFSWMFTLPAGVTCSQCVIQWKWNTGDTDVQSDKIVPRLDTSHNAMGGWW